MTGQLWWCRPLARESRSTSQFVTSPRFCSCCSSDATPPPHRCLFGHGVPLSSLLLVQTSPRHWSQAPLEVEPLCFRSACIAHSSCNCPTPFPHLNALLNHRWGRCYNPVVCLWCGDICVLDWQKKMWVEAFRMKSNSLMRIRHDYSSFNASALASHPPHSRHTSGSKPPLSFYSDSPEPNSSL